MILKKGSQMKRYLAISIGGSMSYFSSVFLFFSSHILQDQLSYKRLQSDLAVQKAKFNEQNKIVKELQKKLQSAVKERLLYKKYHNKVFNEVSV